MLAMVIPRERVQTLRRCENVSELKCPLHGVGAGSAKPRVLSPAALRYSHLSSRSCRLNDKQPQPPCRHSRSATKS